MLVPKGIVCLISALQSLELTLQMPSSVWMAIERSAWRPTISYPPIRFVPFSGWAMTEGVETYPIQARHIPITTPARTIVDCFRYRNQIGLDIAMEGLRVGIRQRKCTADELWQHTKKARVWTVMRPYVETVVSMPSEHRNVGASVRAKLLNRSRNEKSDYQVLLTRYALERLLYRLSVSAHRERFILKGALPFVTWLPDSFRPTRDLDLLGFGSDSPEATAETFRGKCSTAVPDDGVIFDVAGLTAAPIREDIEYGGVRVRTQATIDGARVPIQVDTGSGDIITPEPVEIEYPALLDSPAPRLRAYPVETVIAEKFNAMVTLGLPTSASKRL